MCEGGRRTGLDEKWLATEGVAEEGVEGGVWTEEDKAEEEEEEEENEEGEKEGESPGVILG